MNTIDWPEGLIPACAGKTTATSARTSEKWAHPRVCGENAEKLQGFWIHEGSSPRVRGKLEFFAFAGQRLGLIPACAGKTFGDRVAYPNARAHPRVCGENFVAAVQL